MPQHRRDETAPKVRCCGGAIKGKIRGFHCCINIPTVLMRGAAREKIAMIVLLAIFCALAAFGAATTIAIHLATLFGIAWPFEHCLKYVVPWMFAVFVPSIFVMNWLSRDFKQKDVWKAAFRGCPRWMIRAFYGIVGYAWIGSFGLHFLYGGAMDSPPNTIRSMSAILMIFFLVPALLYYSAIRVRQSGESRRCLNGHRLPPLAKFCEECGAPPDEQGTA